MNVTSVPKSLSKSKGKSKRNHNASIKVVYISSPMKVKTSASRFRALVQELTGRDSNVATLMMEANNYSTKFKEFEEIHEEIGNKGTSYLLPPIVKHEEKSPLDETKDMSKKIIDVFSNTHHHQQQHIEEELIFPLDFIYESSLMDILGSYNVSI